MEFIKYGNDHWSYINRRKILTPIDFTVGGIVKCVIDEQFRKQSMPITCIVEGMVNLVSFKQLHKVA